MALTRSKLFAGIVLGMVAAVATAAVAQNTPPAAASTQSPAPATVSAPTPAPVVVAPVVPQSPARNPGAVAAIEQSVTTAPQPVPSQATPGQPGAVVAQQLPPGSIVQPSGPAPYVVPPSGPGIYQGSDQTLREIAYLQTEVALNGKRKERIDSVAALRAAEKDLADQLAGKSKDDQKNAQAPGTATPGGSPAAVAVVVAPKPEPYVNSVYGYGDNMYAEIVLGSGKVLATKGTVLVDGSRVISVSNSGVTLATKHGTKKLAIRGSAGL